MIGTASRPESQRWVLDQGAHRVVGRHDLPSEIDWIFTPHSTGMIERFAEILRPYGAVVAIDEPQRMDLLPLKSKSITWHWELMFTRALYDPASSAQHHILREIAALIDKGVLHTTLTTRLDGLDAANLREAHRLVESGTTVGKVVVARS
ncbi:zinc-binding dehydrogenase [Paractinoplanes atraurantiacus]|uniref:Zinc-binding dehydrogenase n=1 Tax=Paractinoplanes atraurantiacus TaxID=1036182 RepID=A0A285GP49_9ACTN|nr:zinc-binding dehydrogenase [Actinoplanes atraurantiacus]SNY25342.1 Zinc-binding dehydrogenase [Actinoplanes atraurantiacus]